MRILVGQDNGALPRGDVHGMHELRYRVFRERLQWDIPVSDECERDDYDDFDPVFFMAREKRSIVGCCRILPTTGPYMLRNTFPELLGKSEAPVADDVWEISRFAVEKAARPGLCFSTIPETLIGELVRYALENRIRSYVFVTTTGFERLLKRMGVNIERFADPMQIGVERSVALWMHNDTMTIRAAGHHLGRKSAMMHFTSLQEAA